MSFTVLQLFAGATALKLVGRISKLIAEKAWEDINLWLLVGLLLFVVKYFIDDLMDVNHLMNGNLHKEDKYRYLKLCVLAIGWLGFYGGVSLVGQDKVVGVKFIGILIGIFCFTILLSLERTHMSKCSWWTCILQNIIIIAFCLYASLPMLSEWTQIFASLPKISVGWMRVFAFLNFIFMFKFLCLLKLVLMKIRNKN